MSLYPDRPGKQRLAVFARYEFPHGDEARLYAELDRLAARLDIEYRVFHCVVPDPRGLGPALRPRLGAGVVAPLYPALHANDVEHFRTTLPSRCAGLLAAMAKWAGPGPADLLQRREVRESFSLARLARAWHADAVLSWGLGEGAVQAFVTASLLGLPRLVALADARGQHEYGELLPMHVDGAHAVVALGEHVAAELGQRLGPARGPWPVVVAAGGLDAAPVPALVAAALAAHDAARATMGPRAAFVTRPRAPAAVPPAGRLLVLGTERTGSNLLVGMLAAHPAIACAGELFNARSYDEGEVHWLAAGGSRDPELLRLRRHDPQALLDRLVQDGARSGARWVGCKLLYLQAEADDRIVDALAGDGDLRVVHLLRRARLARWLSLARARRSDAWFTAAGAAPPPADGAIELEPRATAAEFVLGAQQEERGRAVFRRHRVLELDYVGLVHELPAAARCIGELLDLDLGSLTPHSRKTGPEHLAGAIANFEELRAAFAGTGWADQFG